ncbi:MAG: polysaccharide biosynthesis protein, partial [Bacilli bacterium]
MKKNEFIEGAFIATLAIIISKILGVLYVIPFYKIIGENGGSLYGYAYNIYNFFLIISSAGIPLAISKITSEYNTLNMQKEKSFMFKYAQKIILIFSIICFFICFLGSGIFANLIVGDLTGGNTVADVAFVIRCVSFAILVVPLLSITRGYLQGHQFITAPSIGQVIEQFVRVFVIVIGSFLALKVFGASTAQAVGVAVFGACIGAIISYIYLYKKMNQVKSKIFVPYGKISKEEKKSILKKLIGYCIPFIVINVANSLYNSVDMILIIKGLNNMGYSATDIETISSIFTTWGSKLISIVTAVATGLVVSLVPSIVAAFTKHDNKEVNNQFNKTLQVLLYVILPLSLFISIFSTEIWTIFYGKSFYGPLILKYTILIAVLDSAYIMICCALQGLSKTKLIYVSVLSGVIINALLDLPLMYLFNHLGLYPFYGAIAATAIG